MAGWDNKNGMSNSATLAIEHRGMIPFACLNRAEMDRLMSLDDDTYEAVTTYHHLRIEGRICIIPFVEAAAVGRKPLAVYTIKRNLTLAWDGNGLGWRVAWRGRAK